MQPTALPLTGGVTADTSPVATPLNGKTGKMIDATSDPTTADFAEIFAADGETVIAEAPTPQLSADNALVVEPEKPTVSEKGKAEEKETTVAMEEPELIPDEGRPRSVPPPESPDTPARQPDQPQPDLRVLRSEPGGSAAKNLPGQAQAVPRPAAVLSPSSALMTAEPANETRLATGHSPLSDVETIPLPAANSAPRIQPAKVQAQPGLIAVPRQASAPPTEKREVTPTPPVHLPPSQQKPPPVPTASVGPMTIAPALTAKTTETREKTVSAPLETFAIGRSDAPTTHQTNGTTPFQPAPRSDLAAHVARQIADVAHHLPGRPVEITLSPEELGRVRLSVSTHEAGIILNVTTERPETADLLRRHIGQLGAQFQSLGYESIAFSFSGGGGDQAPEDRGSDETASVSPLEDSDATPLQIALSTHGSAGVDIRL